MTYVAIDIKYLVEIGIRSASLRQCPRAEEEKEERDSTRRHFEENDSHLGYRTTN